MVRGTIFFCQTLVGGIRVHSAEIEAASLKEAGPEYRRLYGAEIKRAIREQRKHVRHEV